MEERALEDDDGAKADADASKRKERAPVSFMMLIRRVSSDRSERRIMIATYCFGEVWYGT